MEEPKKPKLQWDKIVAAVAYLTERSRHDDQFGVTKLVKLLYYADCAAYIRTGEPINGVTYIHMPHGPYPNDWETMMRRLQDERIMGISNEDIRNGQQRRRPIAGVASTTQGLTELEQGFLDDQLRRFADFNASQIEE